MRPLCKSCINLFRDITQGSNPFLYKQKAKEHSFHSWHGGKEGKNHFKKEFNSLDFLGHTDKLPVFGIVQYNTWDVI